MMMKYLQKIAQCFHTGNKKQASKKNKLSTESESKKLEEGMVVHAVVSSVSNETVYFDYEKTQCVLSVSANLSDNKIKALKVGNSLDVVIDKIDRNSSHIKVSLFPLEDKQQPIVQQALVQYEKLKMGMVIRAVVSNVSDGAVYLGYGNVLCVLPISAKLSKEAKNEIKALQIGDSVDVTIAQIYRSSNHIKVSLQALESGQQVIVQQALASQRKRLTGKVESVAKDKVCINIDGDTKIGELHYKSLAGLREEFIQKLFQCGDEFSFRIKSFEKEQKIFLAAPITKTDLHSSDEKALEVLNFLFLYPLLRPVDGLVTKVLSANFKATETLVKLPDNNEYPCQIVSSLPQEGDIVSVVLSAASYSKGLYIKDNPLANLKLGMVLSGRVTSITSLGAFIRVRGITGLLHKSDMAWRTVKTLEDINKIVQLNDTVKVKLIRIDQKINRIAFSLKELDASAWETFQADSPVGTILEGRVESVMDYGCFISFNNHIHGLLHKTEMSWNNKEVKKEYFPQVDEKLMLQVVEVDADKQRVGLSLKYSHSNPWLQLEKKYKVGDRVLGKVSNVVGFGIFISLEENIDGLFHWSDFSSEITQKESMELMNGYEKDDLVLVTLASIDIDKQRIGLSELSSPYTLLKSPSSILKPFIYN